MFEVAILTLCVCYIVYFCVLYSITNFDEMQLLHTNRVCAETFSLSFTQDKCNHAVHFVHCIQSICCWPLLSSSCRQTAHTLGSLVNQTVFFLCTCAFGLVGRGNAKKYSLGTPAQFPSHWQKSVRANQIAASA